MSVSAEFLPAWASPPGETVRELAQRKGLTQAVVASALGVAESALARVLDGDLPITEARAERLAASVGATPRFWLAREAQYRHALQAIHDDTRAWVSSLPFADMAKFGWLSAASTAADKLHQAFAFFGVSSVDEWRDTWLSERAGLTAYRTSPVFTTQGASAAAWLRQGEQAASRISTAQWSRADFERILPELKPLTRVEKPTEFIHQLQRRCAECGVAVVIVRTPKGCPASGATRVRNGQAILQLSARYLRDDSFWFTFFHEAGHLVLHEDRLFLEWSEKRHLDEKEEREANDFAGKVLIPPSQEAALRALPHEYKAVMRFARKLSVSPGIVVGQLQHRGLVPRDKLNFLKKRYTWG
ncbi:ImmA/IrrE family metallo-endopeptidase [Variovorax sp. EL159]|uniref:ImmA/IrrE family metallo-endopeptidase n=1 Tax=Variovorax sp. EL159 TaxID=1566270 RepID=UPI0008811534|nr:ImmA/IrrE family metallo-endopeptidase [Variovorax sp. EL159]SCX72792.1 Helix-turn-helix domain-containing protein [Variovorax sp. EL159]